MLIAAERSSWSRHGSILEIPDVSKEEALQYLRGRKLDDKLALQLYELVGGRMVHLKLAANEIKMKNKSFHGMYAYVENNVSHHSTDVRRAMFADARGQLRVAEILSELRYHVQGAAVISALLEKGSISEEEYMALTGRQIGEKLLEANVFAFHFDSSQITFQSTLIRRLCEETASRWKARK